MSAALGALGNDDVGAGPRGAQRLRHGSCHIGDLATGVMGAVEIGLQVLIGPRPCELHHTRTEFESSGEAVFTRVERQEIQAERLLDVLADSGIRSRI